MKYPLVLNIIHDTNNYLSFCEKQSKALLFFLNTIIVFFTILNILISKKPSSFV